ncbi:MAG: hypothetical protein V4692_07660 [Bdellovibrionota bacterium]
MENTRELNPQLFGTPLSSDALPQAPGPAASVMPKTKDAARGIPYAPNEIKNMDAQIANLGRALLQMEKRTETIASKMEELARGVHTRLERFTQNLQRFEEAQKRTGDLNAGKFAAIVSKVNERKVSDSKVEEMIERHNSIVRGFEARLISLQRLVNEQEMALHGARAAIEEARRK